MHTATDSDILTTGTGEAQRNVIIFFLESGVAFVQEEIFFPASGQEWDVCLADSAGKLGGKLRIHLVGMNGDLISCRKKTFDQQEHVGLHATAAGELVVDNGNLHSGMGELAVGLQALIPAGNCCSIFLSLRR